MRTILLYTPRSASFPPTIREILPTSSRAWLKKEEKKTSYNILSLINDKFFVLQIPYCRTLCDDQTYRERGSSPINSLLVCAGQYLLIEPGWAETKPNSKNTDERTANSIPEFK